MADRDVAEILLAHREGGIELTPLGHAGLLLSKLAYEFG
jgi:hypothetical protein